MIEIFVYRAGADSVEENVEPRRLPELLKEPQTFVWIDMEQPTAEEEEIILSQTFHFHPLTIED